MDSQETIRRKVRVVTEVVVDIELTSSVFGDMSVEEYLKEFRESLGPVDSIDDVVKYAASEAASHNIGVSLDGIGVIGYASPMRKADVVIHSKEFFIETEIIEGDSQ